MTNNIKKYNYPDSSGHFEEFGGKYVPETLIPALNELEKLLNLDEQEIYDLLILDKERFRKEFSNLKNFS